MEYEVTGSFVHSLRQKVDAQWGEIKRGEFWRVVQAKPTTHGLWRDLLLQVYHYSRHNSLNQAACAFVEAPEGLMKFVYRHASEELGHEKMVIHDLRSLDLWREEDAQGAPLPATEALIGYLYFVALRYGPVPRLGYSFWAEGAHAHIQEPLAKFSRDLGLTSKNITFFGAHAEADQEHIQQVEEAIERFARTPREQEMVERVAVTTLSLTGQLLEQVAQRHR
jgi:thiaminase